MVKQNRISIIGIVAVAALLLFVLFVFIPKHRAVRKLNAEIKGIDKQIAATEEMAGDIRSLGIIIADMQREVESFEKRLPATEKISAVLSECSNIARDCSVEVVSIISEDPKPFLDDKGAEFIFGEEVLNNLQVSFKLRGTYKNLAEYIRNIDESLSILATFDEIEIEKNDDIEPLLDAQLVLSVYVADKR